MKYKLFAVIASTGVLLGQMQLSVAAEATQLTSQTDKISYAIGANIGFDFKSINSPLNADLVAQGIKDSASGNKLMLSQQEINDTLIKFQKDMTNKQQTSNKVMADKNAAEGEKFLADNKAKSGVVTLPSGLQYKIITQGKGPKPAANDEVSVNYEGKTIDGTVFDSSYKRGKAAMFPVSGVIPGWTEALQLMPVGSKWEIYVPAKLAYGATGAEPFIAPNSTLIFVVELLDKKPASVGR